MNNIIRHVEEHRVWFNVEGDEFNGPCIIDHHHDSYMDEELCAPNLKPYMLSVLWTRNIGDEEWTFDWWLECKDEYNKETYQLYPRQFHEIPEFIQNLVTDQPPQL